MSQGQVTEQGGGILYGVPKVEYGSYKGCTPFPICMKAYANYLGQPVEYDAVMAGCGAGFRLTWDTTSWNCGNVDVVFTFDDPMKVYRTGAAFLGRTLTLLGRSEQTAKADFSRFIREEIDKGSPCIALGIIGPPEACLVTGYREHGDVLLGWNVFQDNPEYRGNVSFDPCGYYVTGGWWENRDTLAVMALGKAEGPGLTLKELNANAIEVLTGRTCGVYAKGILAYDYWKKAVADDSQFPSNAVLPILVERLMCQGDAMDTLVDGRRCVAGYLRKLGEQASAYRSLLLEAADHFEAVSSAVCKMMELLGGWSRGEKQLRNLARRDIREEICTLIDTCKEADQRGLETLKQLAAALE
ncbi:hypothetical protein D3C75_652660 [compost metagenome]